MDNITLVDIANYAGLAFGLWLLYYLVRGVFPHFRRRRDHRRIYEHSEQTDANENNKEVDEGATEVVSRKMPIITPPLIWIVVVVVFIGLLIWSMSFVGDWSGKPSLSWQSVAPYSPAILVGIFSYFFSVKGYKSLGRAALVTVLVMIALGVHLNPEVFTAILEPYGGFSIESFLSGPEARKYFLVAAATAGVLALISGYVEETVIGAIVIWLLLG